MSITRPLSNLSSELWLANTLTILEPSSGHSLNQRQVVSFVCIANRPSSDKRYHGVVFVIGSVYDNYISNRTIALSLQTFFDTDLIFFIHAISFICTDFVAYWTISISSGFNCVLGCHTVEFSYDWNTCNSSERFGMSTINLSPGVLNLVRLKFLIRLLMSHLWNPLLISVGFCLCVICSIDTSCILGDRSCPRYLLIIASSINDSPVLCDPSFLPFAIILVMERDNTAIIKIISIPNIVPGIVIVIRFDPNAAHTRPFVDFKHW